MQSDHGPGEGHRVETADLVVLIGWLALYEGELAAGGAPDHLTERLKQLFIKRGLLSMQGSDADFAHSINQLNHRLRRALGENRPTP
jgi:hypothetical protein